MPDASQEPRSPTRPERLPLPARAAASAIPRRHLIERLMQAGHRRAVVLQGPAGCGKTTMLVAWRRELVAMGVDVAWVAVDDSDDDVGRFFDVLLAALSAVGPALVLEASSLAGRGTDEQAVESMVIALVRRIAARRRDLVLVVDDAHILRDARVLMALQLLLDYGPPNLACAFASRGPLPVSLARLRAQDKTVELGIHDLRLTPAESAQLVQRLLGRVDERLARSLHERTDGWVAGLELLCLDLRRARGKASARPAERVMGERVMGERVMDERAFARHFERTLLCRLSPADATFLVRCAVPEHFNDDLCAALFEEPPVRVAGAALLARLESHGLFIAPAGPRYPEGWWRLHPLMRNALLSRVEALPRAEQQRLHSIAWQWFAAHGMQLDAVRHALMAGAPLAAADLVEACADDLFADGDLRRLIGLLRLLPEPVAQARPGLRLWMAWMQVYERRLADCAQSIAQLAIDLAGAPPAQRYRLTLLRGMHAVQCDDTAAAVEILPDLLDAPADADGIAVAGRRNLLTWIHLYQGDYERARQAQYDDDARTGPAKPLHGTPFGTLAGRCLLGLTHAVQGQMLQAERIYRDVLFEADRRGPACADASCLAAGLLGEILYELNDTAGASALLEERLDVLERVSIPDTVVRVMLVLGRSRWLAGRPLDAFAYLEQIEDYAEQSGLDRLRAYSLLEQLQFRLRQGDVPAARQLMAELERIDARHVQAETGALSEIRVAAERARIQLLMHAGDQRAALPRLEALSALCAQRGRVRRIPYLRVQAAAIERTLGNAGRARGHLLEALRLGHRLGLVRTLLDAHDDLLALLHEAGDDARRDPVLGFYAERLEAAARDPGSPAGSAVPVDRKGAHLLLDALSPREAEIAQLLLQAMPNKKIARVLDVSVETVKWHLKNLYGKLGVTGRDEVVERLRASRSTG